MTTLYFGSMRSSKSSAILHDLDLATIKGLQAILLRPKHDTREHISRDRKLNNKVTTLRIDNDNYGDVLNKLHTYNKLAIGIDEIHFIDPTFLQKLLVDPALRSHDFYLSGLLFGKDQIVFNSILAILPYIDTFIQCKAICEFCGNDATITFLKSELQNTTTIGSTNQDINDPTLTGDSQYGVCCKQCFLERIYDKRLQIADKG